MVWDEAEIVIARVNAMEATRATLLNLAIASVLSNKAQRAFAKQVKELAGNGE